MNNVQALLSAVPGSVISLRPDWFVLSDAAAHAAVPLAEGAKLSCRDKVKVFIDHETPCGSEKVAAEQKKLINFAKDTGCELFNGYGINYQLMLDKYVQPGQLILHCGDFGSIYGSSDSFAISVSPSAMAQAMVSGKIDLTVPQRFSLKLEGNIPATACGKDAALAVVKALGDLGGKLLTLCGSGLDSLVGSERVAFFQFLSASGCVAALPLPFDDKADLSFDLGSVVPMVADAACLSDCRPAAELDGTGVSSVFIGGCSAGRIEDIRLAAELIKGRQVNRKVRLTVAFASSEVYVQAANEGLISTLLDGGAVVMNQGCSACYAHSQGLVDNKDVVLSAGSRECPDCLGTGKVKTYLCSAATAMESAIAGQITPVK